jgi:hypothetical protein
MKIGNNALIQTESRAIYGNSATFDDQNLRRSLGIFDENSPENGQHYAAGIC